MLSTPWQIPGSDDQPLVGDAHLPAAHPSAVAILCHGFLGYKDYGLFPHLASALAQAGILACRFNFSHSGMTRRTATFERPDLFERDTWRKQAFDLGAVVDALAAGGLPGAAGPLPPLVLVGHSRGGVTCLLAAAGRFRAGRPPLPAGVITVAAPDTSCSWDEQKRAEHRRRGYTEVVSNRTGQTLRIGQAWLQEQTEDPEWHDPLAAAAAIECPVLAIHGTADGTVSPASAGRLASAARQGRSSLITGADHVFNTPNPMPDGARPSPQLAQLISEVLAFVRLVA